MRVAVEEVVAAGCAALGKVAPPRLAAQQIDLLMDAELRGIASHGMLRLPRIIRRIRQGVTDPASTGIQTWVKDAFLDVDGGRGLGPVVALKAIEALEDRVGRTGIAIAAVRNSNHVGMLGYYAEHAAMRGRSMIALTTSEALVHPWGGRRAMIGTNPIAISVPVEGGPPFMMDTATSIVSMGEIHDRANRGVPLPDGWALDASGRPTTDAAAAKAGAIAPFGGAKGYALGLAFELLVSSLAGAALGRDVTGTLDDDTVCNKGDLFILIEGRSAALGGYLEQLRNEVPGPGFDEVRIPGENGRQTRARRMREGIDLPDALWDEIGALAADGAATEGVAR